MGQIPSLRLIYIGKSIGLSSHGDVAYLDLLWLLGQLRKNPLKEPKQVLEPFTATDGFVMICFTLMPETKRKNLIPKIKKYCNLPKKSIRTLNGLKVLVDFMGFDHFS